jgi:hypothetical protein
VGVGVGTVRTTGGGVAGRVTVEPGPGVRLKFSRPGIRFGVRAGVGDGVGIGTGVGVGVGVVCAHAGAAMPTTVIIGSVNARTRRAANLLIIPTLLPLASCC